MDSNRVGSTHFDGPVLDWLRIIRYQTVSEDSCQFPPSLRFQRRRAFPVNDPSAKDSVRDLILVKLLLELPIQQPRTFERRIHYCLHGRDDDMSRTWFQSFCSCFQQRSISNDEEDRSSGLVRQNTVSSRQSLISHPDFLANSEDCLLEFVEQSVLAGEKEADDKSSAQQESKQVTTSLNDSPETVRVVTPHDCQQQQEGETKTLLTQQGGPVTKRRPRLLPPPPFSLSRISEVSCELTPTADLKFAHQISIHFPDLYELVSRHLPSPANKCRRYSEWYFLDDEKEEPLVSSLQNHRRRYSWPVWFPRPPSNHQQQAVARILFHSESPTTELLKLAYADVSETASWTDAVVCNWQTTPVHQVHHADIAYSCTQVSFM